MILSLSTHDFGLVVAASFDSLPKVLRGTTERGQICEWSP